MPGSCEVVGCTNHTLMRGTRPSFHTFPKDPERRYCWILALQKKRKDGSTWTPTCWSRICGNHFIQGKPNSNPKHPDYVPTIFPYNKADWNFHARKRQAVTQCEPRVDRRKKKSKGGTKRKKKSTLDNASHTDHDYAILRVRMNDANLPYDIEGQNTEAEPEDVIIPELPATYNEKDKRAVWLYTVQGGRIVSSVKCPSAAQVGRPKLSGILMANLLPEASRTQSTPAGSQTATESTPVGSQAVTEPTQNSSPPPPPSEPKVMPPCTKDMLFDEITALRSERDKALNQVAEMQSKLDSMTEKLKKKNERLLKQTCSRCRKTLNNGLAGFPRAKSQSKGK